MKCVSPRFVVGVAMFLCAAGAADAQTKVDVAIVLAADVSVSMSGERVNVQYIGHAAAFRSRDVINAITGGLNGAVAVTFVEWAGQSYQRQVVGWTRIERTEDALRFASAITYAARRTSAGPPTPTLGNENTSLSGAIDFSTRLLEELPFEAERLVIDVSGDGVQNEPPDSGVLEVARAAALDRGITINGLPIKAPAIVPSPSMPMATRSSAPVDVVGYYRQHVIGGAGAFMVEVNSWTAFPGALKRKLVMEIAGAGPRPKPAFARQNG